MGQHLWTDGQLYLMCRESGEDAKAKGGKEAWMGVETKARVEMMEMMGMMEEMVGDGGEMAKERARGYAHVW